MATFATLLVTLATELRDPSNLVWSSTMLGRFINKALMDVGRVAPAQFAEQVNATTDALEYTLTNGSEWVEVTRVEVWDVAASPDAFVRLLRPLSNEYNIQTPTGWFVWIGKLYISASQAAELVTGTHVLKVWGYAPYAEASGSTAMPTGEKEHAIIEGARVQAYKSLIASRNLFTQWQAQGISSDLSIAALMSELANAQDEYRRLLRSITTLRAGF